MRKAPWQSMFFAIAMLTFFCLLLSGGSRLIAAPDEAAGAINPQQGWLTASLTCPPSPAESGAAVRQAEDKRTALSVIASAGCAAEAGRIPVTDANGNILRHASYMHAVYQAFALDDGFA